MMCCSLLRFDIKSFDGKLVRLNLLFLLIICGKLEAATEVDFEVTDDSETLQIYGLIFLAAALVFLLAMLVSLFCLCQRSRMLEKKTVEEYLYDESEYDELHEHLDHDRGAVPQSITNQTYVQYNIQNGGPGVREDHHSSTAYYGERQEYREGSRSSYDGTARRQSTALLLEGAGANLSKNEAQMHKTQSGWTSNLAGLCTKNKRGGDDEAVYGEMQEYKESSSRYKKKKETRDWAKKKKRLKTNNDEEDDTSSASSRQGLTDFGGKEVKNQNQFELKEIPLPMSSRNEPRGQKPNGDLNKQKGRAGAKEKNKDDSDRSSYGEMQEYKESRSSSDEVKFKRKGSLVPKSFTSEAYEQYNANSDDYDYVAYNGESQEYKESWPCYAETPQKHEVQVKRRGSLVSKSFADEAYEQYNGNMKGKLGKNEDGYANVAYYGGRQGYKERRSSYDEAPKENQVKRSVSLVSKPKERPVKRTASLVSKPFTDEAYWQYNGRKLGRKDHLLDGDAFYGERQEYNANMLSCDQTDQHQFERKVSVVRKPSTNEGRMQYNKIKGTPDKDDDFDDDDDTFYGKFYTNIISSVNREEYKDSIPRNDKTRQQHRAWIEYQEERSRNARAVSTTKSFTNEAQLQYNKRSKDDDANQDRAFYGEKKKHDKSRTSNDETTSTKYFVRKEIDHAMEFPREMKVTATVTDPFQRLVSSTFNRERDGRYHLKFMPLKTGSYKVEIRSRGEQVEGSPFFLSVVEPQSTLVRMRKQEQTEETRYLVGHELDIALNSPDAPDEGFELSCMVKGPDEKLIQSSIEREEDDLYHVKFLPRESGVYNIHVRCGREPVENSPFFICVEETDNEIGETYMQGKELRVEKVMKSEVDFALEIPFQIDVRDLAAAVLGPGGEKVPSQLVKSQDGKYHIQFQPNKPGQFKIYVRYEGELVEDAPYIVNMPDQSQQNQLKNQSQLERRESAVRRSSTSEMFVQQSKTKERLETSNDADDDADIAFYRYHQVPFMKQLFSAQKRQKITSKKYYVRHEIDQTMEFPREMKVTAIVMDPYQRFVSSTFRREADGRHHLRFTPYKRGSYTVDIRSRGKPVEGSPFTLSVNDAESTLVRMKKSSQKIRYLVGHELDLALDSPEEDIKLSCLVEGPDDETVQSSMEKEEDDLHHVKFLPYRAGVYKVHVSSGGEAVENSPFLIPVGNPETSSRVMLSNVTQAKKTIKSEVDFALEIPSHIDERDFMATVLGPGGEKAASQLDKGKDGKYHIIFVPNEQGQYKIYVRYRGELVEDTPYIVNLTDKRQRKVKIQSQLESKESVTTKNYKNETSVQYKKKRGANYYKDIAF